MKVISAKEAEKRQNSDNCLVTQYSVDEKKLLDLAHIELKGRYPKEGCVRNLQARELVY